MSSFITASLRPRIIEAAAQYRLPAIYGHRFFASGWRFDFLWKRISRSLSSKPRPTSTAP
jgi:hypothetical protein